MNKKFKVGLIRVLTTEDEEVLQSHGKQIMEYFPELEVVSMKEYTALSSVKLPFPKLLKQHVPLRM